jgi:hypothetical protein
VRPTLDSFTTDTHYPILYAFFLFSFLVNHSLYVPVTLPGIFWFVKKIWSGFEVLTAMFIKISIYWDITPCRPLKVNRCFAETCWIHLQGRKTSWTRNLREAGSKQGSLKKEATFPSETSIDFQRTTRCYIPEDTTLHFMVTDSF